MASKLDGVHPDLVTKIQKVIAAMADQGHELVVVQGLRTVAQQQALYAQGRTKPGKKVTNCDGIKKKSNHQAKADGWGHAVDCAFKVDGKVSWADSLPWALYGQLAKAEGLVWGGDWVNLVDRPHVELA